MKAHFPKVGFTPSEVTNNPVMVIQTLCGRGLNPPLPLTTNQGLVTCSSCTKLLVEARTPPPPSLVGVPK